ncbi:MAG TPA: hypothetical protein VMX13_08665 [Sedimentisphaerales bacterium]|nr:hypothetical protein [Sedimentisphaerales bacterium]
MKTVRSICLFLLLMGFLFAAAGCGKKAERAVTADENKPIPEVKAEAEKMSLQRLRTAALAYKDAVVARRAETEQLMGRFRELPLDEMFGEEAKSLQAEIESANKSIAALTERFQLYCDRLKEKGGDLSDLKI